MELPKLPSTKYLAYISFTVLLSGCAKQSKYPEWLLGTWESSYDGFKIQESWTQTSNGFSGVTLWKEGNKTREERISLKLIKNKLVYHIDMKSREVEFVCKNYKSDTLVFINNDNDFPKRIIYVKPDGDNMSVWIENSPNDPNQMSFPFKKIQ